MTKTKMKTKRAAAKRLKVTGTGKIMSRKAFKSHLLTKKSSKRKRALTGEQELSKGDTRAAKRLIPSAL